MVTLALFRTYWRFVLVTWRFFPLVLAYARDRHRYILFGRSRSVDPTVHRERAATLVDAFVTLGPTFIKLGQLLSTRPDVLPPAYTEELSSLQDRVPPSAWPAAEGVIEEELGSVDERFSTFDSDAISGASLGQVYRATIDELPVAVKVRRPGIEPIVEADLRVVARTIPVIMRFVDENRAFSLETLTDEFAKTIREEMDYHREAAMLLEIRENLASVAAVRIPHVIDTHSTGRVLTMEYVEGTKITDLAELDRLGTDRSQVAETLERAYLQMILDDGVFHADPHPGNLAVREDGTIVFYDFGMSGRVDPVLQSRIIDFYVSIANGDIDAVLDSLIEMGTLSPTADRYVMGEVMTLAIEDARGRDIEQYRIQQIIDEIEDTIYEFPLRLPSNLALVMRVATVVEGVCVTLDPEFDFIEIATAYLTERGYRSATARQYMEDRATDVREATVAMTRIPTKFERTLDAIDRGSVHVEVELDDPDRLFEHLARRIVLGLLLSVGLVSTAIIYAFRGFDSAVAASGLLSLLIAVALWRSFRQRRRGIRARPQFTRQSLRDRRDR